jgi:hypothetical protein
LKPQARTIVAINPEPLCHTSLKAGEQGLEIGAISSALVIV